MRRARIATGGRYSVASGWGECAWRRSKRSRAPPGLTATDDPGRRFGPWRREVGSFLELFALCGVAIAQPTLDIFQQNADFLLSRRTTVQEAVAFAVLFIVVPAAVLWTVEVLVGLVVPVARRWVHAAFGAVLVGIVAVELLKRATGAGVGVLLAAGAVCGVIAGVAMFRFAIVRTFLRYLSVAPPVFGVLFVFSSAVTPVIFVSDPTAAKVDIARPKRVVMIVMDEFPTASLLDGKGQIDGELFPEPGRARAGLHVVPQPVHGRPAHDDGGPGDPHRGVSFG